MPEAVWAYDFACNLSLDAIQTALNAANAKCTVHEYPGNGLFKLDGLGPLGGYKAQFEIGPQSAITRLEIEVVFRRLLGAVQAQSVTKVEPFF